MLEQDTHQRWLRLPVTVSLGNQGPEWGSGSAKSIQQMEDIEKTRVQSHWPVSPWFPHHHDRKGNTSGRRGGVGIFVGPVSVDSKLKWE